MSTSDKLLVAAIYLGTTHSSIAYSLNHDYTTSSLRVMIQNWFWGCRSHLVLNKTRTCVLFNKDRVFDSFGSEAEDKYSELAEKEEHQEWYFFRDFKLSLLNKMEPLSKAVKISTTDGKEMVAMDVFSAAIKFLKNTLQDNRVFELGGIRQRDIHWVLTVPSIWDDAAKHFMREAAEKASISGKELLIVSEPEAGFVYCMYEDIQKNRENCSMTSIAFEAGTKCMVVVAEDIGVEIAVYDVQHRGLLKKLYSTYNFDWGGNKVNASLCSLLTDVVGDDVMKAFLSECEYDFHQLLSRFEKSQRLINPQTTGKFTLSIPLALIDTFTEMNPESDINAMIASKPKYNKKVNFIGDKLRIDADIAKSLFDESCSKIIYHMQELLLYPTLKDVSSILLAGSYADSPMREYALREAFKYPHREVFVPQDAESAVLKGAVFYGHQQIFS